MSKRKYTALILGANGLIGYELLQTLLKTEEYAVIYAVTRRRLAITDNKLVNIISDTDNIEQKIKDINVDHYFCCIGTTKSKTPNNQEYYKIDHDYPLLVSKILKDNRCQTVSLVSSLGANTESKNFYLNLKGKIEQSIIALNYKSTQIFRPSLLIGKRNETRVLEAIGQKISPILNFFLRGKMKDYKSIDAKSVASAMIKTAITIKDGVHIYQTEEIKEKA